MRWSGSYQTEGEIPLVNTKKCPFQTGRKKGKKGRKKRDREGEREGRRIKI